MPHRTIADTTLRNAKQMRSYMTKAEEALWQIVRAHRLGDLPFRRQTPIGPYVADFVCHSAKLIVEADGKHHAEAATENVDRKRTNLLLQRGYKVMRFANDEILDDRDRVAILILKAAQNRISPPPLRVLQ